MQNYVNFTGKFVHRDPDLGKVVLYQLSYSRMSAFAVWVRII